MNQVTIHSAEALVDIIHFAREQNCTAELAEGLFRLLETLTVGMKPTSHRVVAVQKDFAPHSLTWCIWDKEPTRERVILAGGLIYEGPGVPGDGSAPSFSVNVASSAGNADTQPKHRWLIHT